MDSAMLIDTAGRAFGIVDNFKITDLGPWLTLDRSDLLVEVGKASAGVWAAERSWLFKPDVRPSVPHGRGCLGSLRRSHDSARC
jgi:hypothetical protein